MNASKENARKAITVLELMLETTRVTASDRESFLKAAEFLSEFLTAAERKLPGEGSYNRGSGNACSVGHIIEQLAEWEW